MRNRGWMLLGLLCAGLAQAGPMQDLAQRLVDDSKAWGEVSRQAAAAGPAAVAELVDVAAGEPGPLARNAFRLLTFAAETAQGAARDAYAAALLAELAKDRPMPVKLALADLAGRVAGAAAVPGLAALLDSQPLREQARRALAAVPAPQAGAALRERYAAAQGEWQLDLLAAVVERGDRESIPWLADQLKRAQPAAAVLLLHGLARAGDPRSLSEILPLLRAGHDPAVLSAARDAALALAATAEPGAAVPVYETFAQSDGPPHLVAGAVRQLGAVGSASSLPALFRAADNPAEQVRRAASQALTSLKGETVSASVVSQLAKATPAGQVVLLEALAAREKAGAVPMLTQSVRSPDAAVREAALGLLGEVGGAADAALVLERAGAETDELKPAAVRAYLRLAVREGEAGRDEAARDMLHRGFAAASRDEERVAALRALATLADPASLELVRGALGQGPLRGAAADAALAIAEKLHAAGQANEAMALAESVLRLGDRGLANRAAQRLRALGVDRDFAREAGFVTHWWVIGAFPNPNNEAADKAYFPEQEVKLDEEYDQGGKKLRWREITTTDVSGVVDLVELFKPARDNVAAYAYTEVTVPQAQQAVFKIGSDDGVIVWLNGQQVHRQPGNRALSVDQDTVRVNLVQGTNRILFKVLQGGGGWEHCLRIQRPDGAPLAFE